METSINQNLALSNEDFFELLERLCRASGVSGFEDGVQSEIPAANAKIPYISHEIASIIKPHSDSAYFDNSGNIIAFKKGAKKPSKKILFLAHCDEVGFVVKHIRPDGTLLFDSIGISPNCQPCNRVFVGPNFVSGVIGLKPVHLLSGEVRKKGISESELYIDIGARSREQAQALVNTGDAVLFDSDFIKLSPERIKAKALDDRMGCAALCELISRDLPYDTYFAFTTGEELGTRGAYAVTARVKPDIAVIAESTTASDIPGCEGKDKVCTLGEGVVLPFMDGGTCYDRDLRAFALDLAEKSGIKVQTKSKIAGGTDARTVQRTCGGCKVLGVALACRYIHTASSVSDTDDIYSMRRMISVLADGLGDFAEKMCEKEAAI